jgi:hypothetical protein
MLKCNLKLLSQRIGAVSESGQEEELGKVTTTVGASETLERVENIVKMLDEICDHMDGFLSAEEAWPPASQKPYALGAMSYRKPTTARKRTKGTEV